MKFVKCTSVLGVAVAMLLGSVVGSTPASAMTRHQRMERMERREDREMSGMMRHHHWRMHHRRMWRRHHMMMMRHHRTMRRHHRKMM